MRRLCDGQLIHGCGEKPQGLFCLLSGKAKVCGVSRAGKELLLTKALTTLGKPGVQVAVITRRPQGYFITHVEGANFPVVNGDNITINSDLLTVADIGAGSTVTALHGLLLSRQSGK